MNKIMVLVLLFVVFTYQKGLTKKELETKMIEFNLSPIVTLLLIYDSLNPKMEPIEGYMKEIEKRRKGYFNTILIDCNTDSEEVKEQFIYCSEENRKLLPALVFSQPNLNQDTSLFNSNPLENVKQYQGALDEKSLFNFAVPLMNIYSVELKNAKDVKLFQESNPKVPKIIYFTDKEKKDKFPPLFRAITANFRHTIAFAHVFSTSPVANQFNITKFPQFILNGNEKIEIKSNLTEMIERLNMIKGDPTTINIKEFEVSNSVELTPDNLEELVYKLPEYTMIHVIDEEGKDHSEWKNITKRFGKMFKLYETTTLKDVLGVKQTPSIIFYPKSVAKKLVQKTIFAPRETYDNIYNEIDSIIEDFSVPISNFMELQKLTGIHLQDEKFVAIYFHTEQIPLSYKVIANDNRFHEEIAFFRMKDPEPQIIEQYQLKNIPSLIVMMMDKEAEQEPTSEKDKKQGKVNMALRLASYKGKFVYNELLQFFKAFSKKAHEEEINKQNSAPEPISLKEITKEKGLKKQCEENCFLLLVNGNPENKEKNNNYISLIQKESERMPTYNFASVNGACHTELLGAFDILEDELPALVFINAKFEKYARMVGRLESSSVSTFLAKVKLGKSPFRGYDKLNFENKNCESELERLRKLNEQGSVINEDEAAILEELKAEEEKKRQELGDAQKDEKVKKKNKKKRPKREWEQDEEL